MEWVQWPIEITLNPAGAKIDGVAFTIMQIAEIVSQIIHPDPRKWYRLERVDNRILFHVKVTEDEPNGTYVGTTGTSETNPGASGAEAPHP